MTIGTFAYPGSKTTYASWIIDHIPEHHLYVEPFGGAASVLVAKSRSELEVYNDINGDCVDFFKAVRDKPVELERWVKHTPYSRELFNEYVETYPDWPDDPVERAGRFLFVQSSCFGSKGISVCSPTYNIVKAASSRSDDNAVKWRDKQSHISTLSERFTGVNIEKLDYADLVEKYDNENAFFYFDPPYVDVGDDYYQTEDGGFDHNRFVGMLERLDGKWLVSYDQNIPAELDDYYTVSRTKVATMSAQNPEKVETLTMNYDPDNTPMFREQEQTGLEQYD